MSRGTYIVKRVYKNVDVIFGLIGDAIVDGKNNFKHEKTKSFFDPERMKTFIKNRYCVACGIEGTFIRSERINCKHPLFGKNHINFYAVRDNRYVMMTVDHKVLKSKGGANDASNYTTMCETCNTRRGDRFETLQEYLDYVEEHPLEEYIAEKEKQRELQKIKKAEKAKESNQAAHKYIAHCFAFYRNRAASKGVFPSVCKNKRNRIIAKLHQSHCLEFYKIKENNFEICGTD